MLLKVGNDGIYRGPRIESPAQWAELSDAGVKTILNLERGYFETFHGILNQEVVEASDRGIMPVHLQLGDLVAPSADELFAALHIAKSTMRLGGVYVHCLHGVDRTGMVCAMVMRWIYQWSPEDCIKQMFDLGFHQFPYRQLGWVKRLDACLRA